ERFSIPEVTPLLEMKRMLTTMFSAKLKNIELAFLVAAVLAASAIGSEKQTQAADKAADSPKLIRSARSGPWSAPATWEGGKLPAAGARVQIRTGHTVA